MAEMKLTRYYSGKDCTLGTLTDGNFFLYTLENPWLDNQKNISCIPCGTYNVVEHNGMRHKNVWRLEGVDGRYSIVIHKGNYERSTKGCILVGMQPYILGREKMVTHSEDAIEALRAHGGLTTITIEDAVCTKT